MKTDISFKQFLLNETSIDIDLSDPATAVSQAKRAARVHNANPQRLEREQRLKARETKKEAQNEQGPTKSLKLQIARTQERLAMLQKRLDQMEAQQQENETQ